MAGQGGLPWAAAHLLPTRVSQPGCFTTQGHMGTLSSWLRSVEKQEADGPGCQGNQTHGLGSFLPGARQIPARLPGNPGLPALLASAPNLQRALR